MTFKADSILVDFLYKCGFRDSISKRILPDKFKRFQASGIFDPDTMGVSFQKKGVTIIIENNLIRINIGSECIYYNSIQSEELENILNLDKKQKSILRDIEYNSLI